jgi:hypothetical protein
MDIGEALIMPALIALPYVARALHMRILDAKIKKSEDQERDN